MKNVQVALILGLIIATACSCSAMPRKKVIEIGWNSPLPTYLRDHIRQIEKQPFDGVCIKLPEDVGAGMVFDIKKWGKTTAAAREREMKVLASVPQSASLTNNFLIIHGTSTMDWFSDADWSQVEEHLRWCMRAARAARCKGVIWDPEPYNDFQLWRYPSQPTAKERSFETFYAQVRKRGAQFMRIMQQEFPGLVVLSMRQLSDFQDGSPFSQRLLPARDKDKLQAGLAQSWWGLHAAFTNGILDAIDPAVTFVDANEEAYFYTSALDYYRAYHTLKHEALALVAPENHKKYAVQYRVGHAASVDYTAGRWANAIGSFPDYLRKQALELTPEQRARWFEHNVYYSLTAADEYVWVYTEDMNWWEGRNVPPSYVEALASARRKYQNREPLGFTVETMLLQAQEKIKANAKAP